MAKTPLEMNNLQNVRVQPENLLLLVSHCVQSSGCPHKVADTIGNCEKCRQCSLDAISRIGEEFGIPVSVVGGGRQACEEANREQVHAVVAVACDTELKQGVEAIFPKPVLTVQISCPNGPCRDTCVDTDMVRAAVVSLLDG